VKSRIFSLVFVLCSCQLAPALAQEKKAPAEGPVRIASERLVVEQKEQRAVFSGQVVVVQGDLRVECQKLVVTYANPQKSKDPKNASQQIAAMDFFGPVRILKGERSGGCQQARYVRQRKSILCKNDAWVKEGRNRVDGESVEYLLDSNQVRVTKPRAILHVDDSAPGPKNDDAKVPAP
jgi:lipopolysaccharide export system protein LptA